MRRAGLLLVALAAACDGRAELVGVVATISLDGDAPEAAPVRFEATGSWSRCGSDCAEGDTGPLSGLEIAAGLHAASLVALVETQPGHYAADAVGYAAAYDFRIDGVDYTVPAPPYYSAAATASEVTVSPALPPNPLHTGETLRVQILDAGGDATTFDCMLGAAIVVYTGDRVELPACVFPGPGDYTLIVDRQTTERLGDDEEGGQPTVRIVVERRLTVTID